MHANLTRVANSHEFFSFFFFATIMRRKNWPLVRSCWQLSSSASVLAAEGGMAARAGGWKMVLDWGCRMLPAETAVAQPAPVSTVPGATTCGANQEVFCVFLLTLSLNLGWSGIERQRRMCSRCPESVYFPILTPSACKQSLGWGERWDEERCKSCLDIISMG